MLKEYNNGSEFIHDIITKGGPPKKIRTSSHHYSINDFIFSQIIPESHRSVVEDNKS